MAKEGRSGGGRGRVARGDSKNEEKYYRVGS